MHSSSGISRGTRVAARLGRLHRPEGAGRSAVNHDWKRYEGVVAIPEGTKQILIATQIYGPGTVWFDDLDAEYTDDPAPDPIGS